VAGRRLDAHGGPLVHDLRRARTLVETDAGAERRIRQADRELSRVEERGVGLVPEAGEVGRRGDLGRTASASRSSCSWPKRSSSSALSFNQSTSCGSSATREVAGQLEIAVDPQTLDVVHERLEVLPTQARELRHLRREAREAVLDPVREGAESEATVPPARTEADGVRLEHDDVSPGVVRLRVQRCP
jgi:hypothetical protein